MNKWLASSALALATTVALAQGQDQQAPKRPSPEEMRQMMEMSMGAMAPAMGGMAAAMLEAQLRIAERPETAERVATFKKNLYDALIKKGFSAEQAMQLTLSTALPSAAPGR